MQQEKLVKDVADELGRTPGRIRQLCQEHGLGRLLNPRVRILSETEVEALRTLVTQSRPGPKKSENTN